MRRILIVSEFYHPRIGGVERFVKDLSEGLSALGNICTVLCTGDRDEERIESGINVIQIANRPVEFHGINFSFGRKMKKIVKDYDLIHINSFYPIISNVAARICKNAGKPFLFSPHYHGQGHSASGRLLFRAYLPFTRYIFQNANRIHCCSKYEESLVNRDFGEIDCTLIPHGAHHMFLNPRPRNGRLLFVGRMESYKGPQRVVSIVNEFQKRGIFIGADLVGDGSVRKKLEQEIIDLGLKAHVEFHNGLNDDRLFDMIRKASLLILLSDAEAYGLVVSEALSNGTPCLVSDRMALSEFENEPGCFVHHGDYDISLLTDTVEMILKTIPTVGPLTEKIPSVSQMVNKFQILYDEITMPPDA